MNTNNRLHWLLIHLPYRFKNTYKIKYDYSKHNYFFYRNYRWSILDLFSVVRTSKRCFRVMYVNCFTKDILYFSCKSSKETAERIYQIYISTIPP